jgi:uncharacterized protein (UPF0210 family)
LKIRSITCFLNPGWPLAVERIHRVGVFLAEARQAFEAVGYEVQTARLATTPFPRLLAGHIERDAVQLAHEMEQHTRMAGFNYVSLGPALPETLESFAVIPEILAAAPETFLGGMMSDVQTGISLPAVNACARTIRDIAPITPDGFTNLRFAALANVPPGTPFFPAAYHAGDEPAFALATEAADLIVEATSDAGSLEQVRKRIVAILEAHSVRLGRVSEVLKTRFQIEFKGIDFSPAPYPSRERSLGEAVERLGLPAVGLAGTLAGMAFLAESFDRAQFSRTGFSGLMLPVLEDAVLAKRAADGSLTVTDLLLYSAVCGTGLDTIPLPGDVSEEQLAAVLLDLAALAQRLGKPLTARLMPVPGKQAGDPTGFDFAFFANSRVMPIRAQPLKGLFSGDETFDLKARKEPTN